MDQLTAQQIESQNLARAYRENPELFKFRTNVEDAAALARIGVEIPGKELMPPAYLRLWPEDFVVEEVRQDGTVVTVDPGEAVAPTDGKGSINATAVKCLASSIDLTKELARLLGLRDTQVAYAGMKDKAAITAQRISISGSTPEAVAAARSPLFFLKDLAYGPQIGTGHLRGNRFVITLRLENPDDAGTAEKNIAESLARVRESGFYNYYFTQRFGPPRFGKQHWGAAIVRGELDEALRAALLQPANGGFAFFDQIRAAAAARYGHWAEMRAIFEPFPKTFWMELNMLAALERTNDPWEGILAAQEQAKMWLFILESWLFNKALAEEVRAGRTPPASMPVTLHTMLSDAEFPRYERELAALGIDRRHRGNLRHIPFCRLADQRIETVKRPEIHAAKASDGILMLAFTLDKGCYATAFLSHVVNLATGKPLPSMNRQRVDARGALGFGSIAPLTERFDQLIREKTDEPQFDELIVEA